MHHDVSVYLAGKPLTTVELFDRFRSMVLACGECEERVHATQVAWAGRRVFAEAFIRSGWLELTIDLLRQVEHPALLQSFPTTKRIYTHRFTITSADELDAQIQEWLLEAHDTVGPGTRRAATRQGREEQPGEGKTPERPGLER